MSGVHSTDVATSLVSSYLTFSPLPPRKRGGCFLLHVLNLTAHFPLGSGLTLNCPDFPLVSLHGAERHQRQAGYLLFLSFLSAKVQQTSDIKKNLCNKLSFCLDMSLICINFALGTNNVLTSKCQPCFFILTSNLLQVTINSSYRLCSKPLTGYSRNLLQVCSESGGCRQ